MDGPASGGRHGPRRAARRCVVTDRLSALDVSFLYLEEPTTPMHVGGLAVFQPPEEGFDYDRLVSLIEDRISLVPRYRQKIRWVPGHLANPVWVDDSDFDIAFHVRRSEAVPRASTNPPTRGWRARAWCIGGRCSSMYRPPQGPSRTLRVCGPRR